MAKKKGEEPINATEKHLKGLPFRKATDMKKEQYEIRRNIWRRFEEAKVIDEYAQRDEYAFWRERFKKGMVCSYGADDSELVKVYADESGVVRIHINEKNGREIPPDELIEVLVRAVSASFNDIYAKASGVLPVAGPSGLEVKTDDVPNKEEAKP